MIIEGKLYGINIHNRVFGTPVFKEKMNKIPDLEEDKEEDFPKSSF
ncbi:MAG: hypothetical protein HRT71_21195 [Flavobacteriales bacterium]|nr:hypothetical protein [Flavobacteriales bacterium]